MYNILMNANNKDVKNYIINKLMCVISLKRNDYILHLTQIKENFDFLSKGLATDKFIL